MAFGDQELERGMSGPDIVELQLRLSGFRGTYWDGDFGPGTELQVMTFQRQFMGLEDPDGKASGTVFEAIRNLADEYPVDFDQIRCPCMKCSGFGSGRFKGEYRENKPKVEAYHKREYPGVHKAILHAFRAASWHFESAGLTRPYITSGYRCWYDNEEHGRSSTNHMGKALDLDFKDDVSKRDDIARCDRGRGLLVENAGFQIGWSGSNQKSLEPSNIAPSWIHMDVRSYASKYLEDHFFVSSQDELDAP
jgi:hypothetical protein